MKGFVPTPEKVVDQMVARLFSERAVTGKTTVLDPGCGTGVFIEGILRWCKKNGTEVPSITGVELDPGRFNEAREKFSKYKQIKIKNADFLAPSDDRYDFVIGNPPYVSITHLDEEEKSRYRKAFSTARGRFDLYLLFFEQGLSQLNAGGRIVFITPEKFTYVDSAAPLRAILGQKYLEEIRLVSEETFGDLVTYPAITVVSNCSPRGRTKVILRDGRNDFVELSSSNASWLSAMSFSKTEGSQFTLADICIRISCGVATGADGIFVLPTSTLPKGLQKYAYPTIAGRQLTGQISSIASTHSMVVPYSQMGELLNISSDADLLSFLDTPEKRKRLEARTCARHKPWFAFHENPPLVDLLKPKLLCKDITDAPTFWIDKAGEIVPRHSVYYLVPKDAARLEEIAAYLNSKPATEWLKANCQRAANGYIRLQSSTLKRLPIPAELARNKVNSRPNAPDFAYNAGLSV